MNRPVKEHVAGIVADVEKLSNAAPKDRLDEHLRLELLQKLKLALSHYQLALEIEEEVAATLKKSGSTLITRP